MGCSPLSMEFSRQEYWSELPSPSPGDLPDSGIKPDSLTSPALTEGSLPLLPHGKPTYIFKYEICATYAVIQSTLVFSESVPFKYYKHACDNELGKFSKTVSQLRPFLSLDMKFP